MLSFVLFVFVLQTQHRKLKGQSRMDNPENWLHWVHKTQDKDKQNERQHRKLKGQSRMDNPEN
jgi:hypothetical protein